MSKYLSLVLITTIFIYNLFVSAPVYSVDNTVVATVFGLEIKRNDFIKYKSKNIYFLVMPKVFSQYIKAQQITVTDKDIDNYILGMKREKEKFYSDSEKKLKDISASLKNLKNNSREWKKLNSKKIALEVILKNKDGIENKYRLLNQNREIARLFIEKWKIDVSLYKKYGGRIAFKPLSVEPIDAYYKLLKEHEKSGDIKITDEAVADIFWGYFENRNNHIFAKSINKDGKDALLNPDWLKYSTPVSQ